MELIFEWDGIRHVRTKPTNDELFKMAEDHVNAQFDSDVARPGFAETQTYCSDKSLQSRINRRYRYLRRKILLQAKAQLEKEGAEIKIVLNDKSRAT